MTAVIARVVTMVILLGALASCDAPPYSPRQAQLEHRFDMGCLPSDTRAYAGGSPYCD